MTICRVLARWLSGGLRDERGATAVEFAIIAPAFIALLMAIVQTGVVLFAEQAMQTAVTQASRVVMTGQAQAQKITAAQFTQLVCNGLTSIFNCNNVYVNVQSFSSFSQATPYDPTQSGSLASANMNYQLGVGGDVEIVQAFYVWPVFPAPLGFNLINFSGGRLLVATNAFRNEPF